MGSSCLTSWAHWITGFSLFRCSCTNWRKMRLWILKKSLNTLNFLGVYLKDWTSQKVLHCQWGCSGSWSSVIKVFLSLCKKSTSLKIQILRIKRHLALFTTPGILVWLNTVSVMCHMSCSPSQLPRATHVWRCRVTGCPGGRRSQLWIPAMSSPPRSSSTSATLPEWYLQGRKTLMHPKSMGSSINARSFCHSHF